MKLFYSPTSPYVRKVVACAIALGLDEQIERIRTDPNASPSELLAANPLSKVPCLVTDDGYALFDSPVICEYLNGISDLLPLFPPGAGERWRALREQALADGILDASLIRRNEASRAPDAARQAVEARQVEVVRRSLDMLEREPPSTHLDIGSISIACALGYLDLRFAGEDWRATRPRLAAFDAAVREHDCIAASAPPSPSA